MAPKEEIARFRGKYTQGWDALRQARFERQKKMGIVGPDETLPGRLPNTYNWDKLTPEQRDRFDKIMATYDADITGMDKAVGTMIDRLKASGDLDNKQIGRANVRTTVTNAELVTRLLREKTQST